MRQPFASQCRSRYDLTIDHNINPDSSVTASVASEHAQFDRGRDRRGFVVYSIFSLLNGGCGDAWSGGRVAASSSRDADSSIGSFASTSVHAATGTAECAAAAARACMSGERGDDFFAPPVECGGGLSCWAEAKRHSSAGVCSESSPSSVGVEGIESREERRLRINVGGVYAEAKSRAGNG